MADICRPLNKKATRFVILGICLIGLVAAGFTLYHHINHPLRVLKPDNTLEGIDWGHEVARNFDRDIINILLLGFDRTASRDKRYRLYRPDTIMIASLNFKTKKTTMLSIPRDSYVRITGMDEYDKINSAYMYGYEYLGSEGNRHQSGLNTVLGTVQDFLGGVPVHYFFKVDMDSLAAIIDRLGGIDYEVGVQIREPGSGQLLLDKGGQHLNGSQFMDYIRFRGVDGDLGRIERQQNILISAFNQLKQAGKLADLPAIVRSLTEQVETNLTRTQMAALALFGREIGEGDIQSLTFPGNPQYITRDGQDLFYLVINEKVRVEIIKLVFGVQVGESPRTILPGKTTPSAPAYPSENMENDTEPGRSSPPRDLPSEQDPVRPRTY